MSTAAWLSQLKPASFRGVPFKFEKAPGKGGRQLVVHEYPASDSYDIEDMGKPRNLTIEGYVIAGADNGFNYIPARDNLISALEQFGPGNLVHPYLGTMSVCVQDFDWEDSTAHGGMCTFTLVFIPAKNSNQPTQTTSTPKAVADQVNVIRSLQPAQLLSVFNIENYVVNSEAFGQLTSLLKSFNVAQSQIQAALNAPSAVMALIQGLIDPLGIAVSSLSGSSSGGGAVITNPFAQSTASTSGTASSALPTAASVSATFAQLQSLSTVTTTARASTTQSIANRQALITAIQLEAIITYCQLASNVSFASYTDAISLRDQIFESFDLIENSVDDDVFMAMQDLRAAVETDIITRAANLAEITTVTLPISLPMLALAQQLYGPADVENSSADIVARNGVPNPFFMPSGVPLEVLNAWSGS